jgi:hypothetical protein
MHQPEQLGRAFLIPGREVPVHYFVSIHPVSTPTTDAPKQYQEKMKRALKRITLIFADRFTKISELAWNPHCKQGGNTSPSASCWLAFIPGFEARIRFGQWA